MLVIPVVVQHDGTASAGADRLFQGRGEDTAAVERTGCFSHVVVAVQEPTKVRELGSL